jgi:hypothetical protein
MLRPRLPARAIKWPRDVPEAKVRFPDESDGRNSGGRPSTSELAYSKYLCQVRAAHVAPILQQEGIALRASAGEIGQPLAQVAHAPVFLDQLINMIAALTRAPTALDVERIEPAGDVVEGDIAAEHGRDYSASRAAMASRRYCTWAAEVSLRLFDNPR